MADCSDVKWEEPHDPREWQQSRARLADGIRKHNDQVVAKSASDEKRPKNLKVRGRQESRPAKPFRQFTRTFGDPEVSHTVSAPRSHKKGASDSQRATLTLGQRLKVVTHLRSIRHRLQADRPSGAALAVELSKLLGFTVTLTSLKHTARGAGVAWWPRAKPAGGVRPILSHVQALADRIATFETRLPGELQSLREEARQLRARLDTLCSALGLDDEPRPVRTP